MAEIKLNLSDEVIRAHIAASVATTLAKDGDQLLQAVVELAMAKKSNSYSNTTLFEEAVGEMIRKVAKEVFKEWLETRRDTLKKAIEMRLKKSPQKFVNQLADNLVGEMAKHWSVNVKLGFGDD